jgi:alkylation response protein AidB-like acyl-CoA dehydrogenase
MSTDVSERHTGASEAELVERACGAATVLAANAERTEQGLRPAPESIAAVREAGLFAMGVPVEFGGHQSSWRTQALVVAELGKACTSTAWVTALTNSAKDMFPAMLPPAAKADLYADPDTVMAGSTVAVKVTVAETSEGLRVSGRWRIASGCEDATWVGLMAPVVTEGQPPRAAPMTIPRAELAIERSWQVSGMAGSGSHTVIAEDVLVPHHHTFGVIPMSELGKLLPPTAPLRAASNMLATSVGAVHGAIAVVAAALGGDRPAYNTTFGRMANAPLARYWFSEAQHLVDTATGRLLATADALDAVDLDAPPPVGERTRLRMELTAAASECRQAMELLMDLHGASGFALGNPLQRFWRDVAVASRHPVLSRFLAEEDYGRTLLDAGEPTTPNI